VACVSVKGCIVCRGVGGGEGDEGEGEKAAPTRRESGWSLREGGVLPK
jgi:hypothetical protein